MMNEMKLMMMMMLMEIMAGVHPLQVQKAPVEVQVEAVVVAVSSPTYGL